MKNILKKIVPYYMYVTGALICLAGIGIALTENILQGIMPIFLGSLTIYATYIAWDPIMKRSKLINIEEDNEGKEIVEQKLEPDLTENREVTKRMAIEPVNRSLDTSTREDRANARRLEKS